MRRNPETDIFGKPIQKVKKPAWKFLCPLCGVQRALRYRSKLSQQQYVQVAITSIVLIIACWSLFGVKSFFIPFFVLVVFEGVNKKLFRKNIPCPHCGFDATWYRRDVKKARHLVMEYWNNNPHAPKQELPSLESEEA